MIRLRKANKIWLILVAILVLTPVSLAGFRSGTSAASPLAQGVYEISWWTVDGGGETFSSGGDYVLGGTIGQPDPGLLSGGDYTLGGGFWGGGAIAGSPAGSGIYLPLIMKNQ